MQPPFFSVIVPTHGRDAALGHCLEALRCQDFPPERFEVLVVFDGGHPLPNLMVEGLTLRPLTQPQNGPAAARNAGAAQARGEYLVFTDDDCIPAPDWLSHIWAAINQYPGHMVGGCVANILTRNLYAAASQLLVDFLYDTYEDSPLQAQFFTSNNLALQREMFLALGGFDTRFPLAAGEDRELCRRWIEEGHGLFYHPDALVHHAHELTLPAFWQQHFNYGRGAYRYRQQHTRKPNGRLKLEPIQFYVNLLRYPLRRAKGTTAVRLFFLFLLMQIANTTGFFRERLGKR
jgi:GT2 family glycosyltransferase